MQVGRSLCFAPQGYLRIVMGLAGRGRLGHYLDEAVRAVSDRDLHGLDRRAGILSSTLRSLRRILLSEHDD